MAAVNAALMCQLRAGDRVVASRALFGSCRYIIEELLPRFGVDDDAGRRARPRQWRTALKPGARCVFIETPANPTLELIDIEAVADLAHAAGARFIVDNVFATPVLQKPLDARRRHRRLLGHQAHRRPGPLPRRRRAGDREVHRRGAAALSAPHRPVALAVQRLGDAEGAGDAGAARAPALRSTPPSSRDLLAARSGDTAACSIPAAPTIPQHALAQRQMPGGGSLVTFELAGDKARVFRFLNALSLIDISNNLGDAKSLITHPATTTHQRLTPAEPRPPRHHRQHGPPLRRAGGSGRPHRGPGSGAGGVRPRCHSAH